MVSPRQLGHPNLVVTGMLMRRALLECAAVRQLSVSEMVITGRGANGLGVEAGAGSSDFPFFYFPAPVKHPG